MTVTTSPPFAASHAAPAPRHRIPTAAWVLVGLGLFVGVAGVALRFTDGHAAADYGSSVPWGLWIAAYVTLIGASAGAFAFSAMILTLRRTEHYRLAELGLLVALGTFVAGMLNVWLDLGHPFRAWKLLTDTSSSSVMGWMAWLYAAYGALLVAGLYFTRRGTMPRFMERFAWLAFLFAMAFAGAEGALFGVVGAQPTWESGLTPILFLVEAALFGVGLVAAAGAFFGLLRNGMARRLGGFLLAALAVLVVLEFAEFSTGLTASVPAKEDALRAILTGDFWWVFWGVHLGLGIAVPAALLLSRRASPMVVGVAGGLIAAMGIASKLNLVLPALAQEEIEGLGAAFSGPGLGYDYFPSAMEWMVWLGTLGLAGLIVLAGRRYLRASLLIHTASDGSSPTQETE